MPLEKSEDSTEAAGAPWRRAGGVAEAPWRRRRRRIEGVGVRLPGCIIFRAHIFQRMPLKKGPGVFCGLQRLDTAENVLEK